MLRRDALGLGLRAVHYAHVLRERPAIDFFELLSDNYLTPHTPPSDYAREIGAHYPLVLHGVGLNLLGRDALDESYIDAIKQLADEHDASFVSDHLCWSRAGALDHHDLLPTPFTEDLIAYAAERAAYVQARLGRPFALENLSSYVVFKQSTMREWEFYARTVEQADVLFMLDINNVYVSSQNHGFDPQRYIDAIDFSRVAQVHLAGHQRSDDGVIVDTHDRPVIDDVWSLYRYAWQQGGPFPTLLEWDDAIPTFDVLLAELERAREVRT